MSKYLCNVFIYDDGTDYSLKEKMISGRDFFSSSYDAGKRNAEYLGEEKMHLPRPEMKAPRNGKIFPEIKATKNVKIIPEIKAPRN